jgi:hypothetical protein
MALTSPLETRRDARVLRAGSVSLARVFTLLSDEMAAAAEEAVVVVDIGGRTTKKKTDDDDDDDVEGAADGEAEDLLELCEEDVWGTMYGDEEERDDLDAERASVSSDDEDEDDDEGCAARASPERASIRFPPPSLGAFDTLCEDARARSNDTRRRRWRPSISPRPSRGRPASSSALASPAARRRPHHPWDRGAHLANILLTASFSFTSGATTT